MPIETRTRPGAAGLRLKILAGALITTLILVALPLVFRDSAIRQRASDEWVAHTYDVLQRTEAIRAGLRRLQWIALRRRLVAGGPPEQQWREASVEIDRELEGLRDLVRDNRAQERKAELIRAQTRGWLARAEAEADAKGQGARPGAVAPADPILGPAEEAPSAAIEGLLTEFARVERELLDLRLNRSEEAARWNVAVIRLGSGFALVTNLLFALWLIRSIVGPVRKLTGAARRIQGGDFEARVEAPGRDELGQLAAAFNSMASSVQRFARDLERRDVQAGVLRVSEILSSTNDPAHLLESALGRILEVAQCPAGALYIRRPEDGTLRALVTSGVGPELVDEAVGPGRGLIGRAAQGTSALFVAAGDAGASPMAIGHWIGPRAPAEMAYLPMHSGPDLVGVLALASAAPFDDRTRNVLKIVGTQLGTAIQNALAHQTLRRQAVELEARNLRLADQQAEIGRRNAELVAASRLKSEFLANMSHELRTPLTIILGFSNTVLRGTQGPLNEEQATSLRRVYDNGRQLLDLINDILDLSKIEAGQMELDPGPTDPRALADAVADNFQMLARSKGLALRVEAEPGLPREFATDESRLRQVLVNLVSNAVKFTDRGEVVLAARREVPDGIVFEVRDTGPGIAREDIPKVFEQFRQLDGRATRRAGGTGLGLSIVKKLVELLGGTLEVRSEVGHGSSFLLRLPIGDDGPAPPPPQPRAGDEAGKGLILAIDDDERFQALLRETLRGLPVEVRCTSDGAEGLRLAAQLKPDAITLDVMMPGMDGWSVLNALKAGPETADIPVILMTVLSRRGLGMMLGAADFLAKPPDRGRMIRALRRAGAIPGHGLVLVVDDDPDIRSLLAGELRSEGFEVRVAADGVEALRVAREEPPSAVILDLMMPNMDGFAVAAALNGEGSTARPVPILVLTAKDLTTEDIRRLNGRIGEIVQKGSMDVEALVARMGTLLRSIGVVPTAPGTAT